MGLRFNIVEELRDKAKTQGSLILLLEDEVSVGTDAIGKMPKYLKKT